MNAPLASGHFTGTFTAGPRFRTAGDLTLDQFHGDGRVDDLWLGLNPSDFAVLWRLAERPGEPVSQAQLVADLRRIRFGCETGSIADQIEGLGNRLAAVGLAGLIAGDPAQGYVLAVPAAPPSPGCHASVNP